MLAPYLIVILSNVKDLFFRSVLKPGSLCEKLRAGSRESDRNFQPNSRTRLLASPAAPLVSNARECKKL
jgi:hypothetical protein